MSKNEMLTRIYDTLFANTNWPQFNLEKILDQTLDIEAGTITFSDGKREYVLSIKSSAV